MTSSPCRVVHLSSVHYAFDNRIFGKECASLAAAGYDVTLIVPSDTGDVTRDGVRLRALALPASRTSRITRTMFQLYRAALDERAAIYHFHDPELMLVGWLLKLGGKRVIYDVHEDYTGTMMDKQWMPKVFRRSATIAVRACERLFAQTYDQVVAATPKIARKFKIKKTTTIQNFPWLAELRSDMSTPHADREPIVAYVGALSISRGLREMAKATEIAGRSIRVRLITAGKMHAGAGAALEEKGQEHVEHLGLQSRLEIRELLSRARIGIVTLHPTKNYVDSQPTKLYEYMSAGLPVVASDFPVWRNVIETARCGLLVDPFDTQAIARALVWLLTHPGEAEEMGRRGQRAVVDHYNWEREAMCLTQLYSRLMPLPEH